jgi:hypothetical protein
MTDTKRRLAAIAACDRVLSHGQPASMRERRPWHCTRWRIRNGMSAARCPP